MKRATGEEERRVHMLGLQNRQGISLMTPIIVVERDREANGPIVRVGPEHVAERDDLSQALEGVDLPGEQLGRQGRDDRCRFEMGIADPMID